MKNIIYTILLPLSFVCCQDKRTIKYTNISDNTIVDVTETLRDNKHIELSNIIQEIKIIPLETNESSLLSLLFDVKVTDDYIYVRDSYKNGSISIFDISGKFVKRLQHGQAPHEIGNASSMFYNKNLRQMFVLDDAMCKISRFSLDGNFISNYYFYNAVMDFALTDDRFIFIQPSTQNRDNRFTVIRSDTSFTYFDYLDLGREIYDVVSLKYFQEYDDGLNFTRYMDNNIYQYRYDSVYVRYSIINRNNTNIEYSKYKNFEDMKNSESENNAYFKGTNLETEDYLYLKFCSKNEPRIELIWNKKNQSSSIFNRIERSLLWYVNIGSVHCDNPNYLVGIIKPSSLISSFNPEYRWDGGNPNSLLSESEMDLLKTVKEDDNPIVVLLKLKTL